MIDFIFFCVHFKLALTSMLFLVFYDMESSDGKAHQNLSPDSRLALVQFFKLWLNKLKRAVGRKINSFGSHRYEKNYVKPKLCSKKCSS
jgi:hypothetical protein